MVQAQHTQEEAKQQTCAVQQKPRHSKKSADTRLWLRQVCLRLKALNHEAEEAPCIGIHPNTFVQTPSVYYLLFRKHIFPEPTCPRTVVQDALVQLPGEVWALLAKHSKAVEDFVSTPSVATAQHLLVALHAVVPEVVRGVGFQSEEEICSLAEQCLRGLAHAHEHGVCHGDMKPENILCTKSGRLWIADFGSAVTNLEESTVSPASSVTDRDERHANLTHGTMPYLPPEVDDGLLGAPADVWAVGMVMHEMCLMRHPYIPNGAARSQLAARQYARVVDCQGLYSLARLRDLGLLPHRSRQLCCFVDSFLCRDPAKRPTAAELLDHPVFAAGKKLKPAGGSAARAKPAPLNPAGKPAKSGRASLG
ncbi:Serine/threonine-protein kinase PAK mbt [Diplonema papillatum]|nr:Serine/threonine-protein kinase PAK mbt [Diplonema papillatum]